MDTYSFDLEKRAESNIEILKDGDLNKAQHEFFRGYLGDLLYRHGKEEFSMAENLAEWVHEDGSPDVDWDYIQEDLTDYIEKKIDEHGLEEYEPEEDEAIPRPEEDWNSDSFMNVGAVGDLDDPSYNNIWLTSHFYTQEDEIEYVRNYIEEAEAKEYVEMMCNLGNEDEVQKLVKNALQLEREDIALGLAEILVEYEPTKVEELIDKDLDNNSSLNAEFLNMVKEKDQADDLVDFLSENSEFEVG